MIKAGIIGATGYAGAELVRILLAHKDAEIGWYGSRSYVDQKFAKIYGNFFKLVDNVCSGDDVEALAKEADVIFTATPQGFCASVINEKILSQTKIIDLSADFRLKEGLIDPDTIIVDAKSGTSGAGRGAKVANLFCEVNESIKAYGVTNHRHTPEIEEQLGYAAGRPILINFTPHLVPMNRGILVTAYASLNDAAVTREEVRAAYEKYYGDETFIRLLDDDVTAETRWVEGSNYVDIGFRIDPRTHRVVVMGALDNLVKGAAGQAVQNMNLMFGLDEAEGLRMPPVFP